MCEPYNLQTRHLASFIKLWSDIAATHSPCHITSGSGYIFGAKTFIRTISFDGFVLFVRFDESMFIELILLVITNYFIYL